MTTELAAIAACLQDAAGPKDVFGELAGDEAAQLALLHKTYRKLSRAIHPDYHGNSPEAATAFARLGELYTTAKLEVAAHTYGQGVLATVRTKRHSYEFRKLAGTCGAANVYRAVIDGATPVFCHVAQAPDDNDLLRNEATILGTLLTPDKPEAKGYAPMLPEPVESFAFRQDGNQLQVNAFAARDGYVSLADIVAACPNGIDPRDMAWMWRRLLDVLGFAHSRHIVHGAVLPGNISIGLGDIHEVILANWQAAVPDIAASTSHIPAIEPAYEAWYPPEVFRKETPTPSTDILMAARCMLQLLGGDPVAATTPAAVPALVRGFLKSCLLPAVSQRSQNAWQLRKEFGDVCERLWGKPAYRPFYLPQ